MTLNHGTVAERAVAEAQRVNPFYLQARIVDSGTWPGQNHQSKIQTIRKKWQESF